MNKRTFLKILTFSFIAYPIRTLADWNTKAFWASKQENSLKNLFPDKTITESDQISIGVNSFIENGAVVPIKIKTDLPNVSSISIYVENNPNPLIAHFEFSPRSKGFIATRIKVEKPSNIMALVNSNDQLFSSTKFIEVAEGGC